MKKYILTLDEGTTSTRAIIFDSNGNTRSIAQHEFTQIFPKPGFVEHDAVQIFSSQYSSITEAIITARILPEEIAAIGITNQRETTVIWDRTTGEPVYNAIVWQCRRTAGICDRLKSDGYSDYIKSTTGLMPDAYFSGTKIKWILDNVKGVRERAERGELAFGTVDTWLLWKLSNGKIHATDYTNASRTMLFDIHNLCWDKKLLEILDIPSSLLPEVYPSGHNFGTVEIMGADIPVCGIAGDQQAALFGQHCFKAGQIKNTYGTGCFLLMNTGEKPIESKNGLITTVAASLDGEKAQYALEGSVFIGGAVIQWLRDQLGLISKSSDSEACAKAVADNGGVYIVPAFAGLGAPYWDMYAKGTVTGLTRGSNKNHIVRAALESIAYQTDDLISSMKADSGLHIDSVRVDGGAAANEFLMQFQSDISNVKAIRPESREATALGAAFLAGLTCGMWSDRHEIDSLQKLNTEFNPKISEEERSRLKNGWQDAIMRTKTQR